MPRAAFALAALSMVCVGMSQTRPHNYDLIDVKWSVRLEGDDDSLSGDVTNSLVAAKGAKSVRFDFGDLSVDRTEVDGVKTVWRRVPGGIEVILPKAADGKHTYAVRIHYHGRPGAGTYFIPAKRAYPATTPVVYTQGEMVDNRYWLPTYDYPDDKATSQGTIDTPAGWFALSNGKLLSHETKGGREQYRWKMDQAHATYLISFVAGPYDKGHEEWDGTPVDFYVPKGLLDQGQAAFGHTADIVRFYSKLTGFRYPYAKYSQAAVPDFMFGGMENVTCTTQTITALHPQSVDELADSTGLVAHELAHQWFGDTVTCNGWSDAWINEGWASFLPSFYVREKNGQDEYDMDRYGTFQGGLGAHLGNPNRPVVWKGYTDALDMFDGFIYAGGASRMFMLMHMVGEDKFWKATKAYLEERKYTSFDTPAFFKTYSKNLGMDLTPFMRQWFYTSGAPRLTVSVEGKDLVVTQAQPAFDLDLPVWVLDGNNWRKYQMHLSGERGQIELGALAGKPVLVDPECWLMASIENKVPLTAEERIALFKAAPNAGEKLRIMDTMLGDLSVDQAVSLARSIQSVRVLDRFLGRLPEGSQSYLLELTTRSDRALANSAVSRLGQLAATDEGTARIRELAMNDPNDLLRQNAYRILLNRTNDASLAERAWKTEGVGDGYRRIALDWWMSRKSATARERAMEALDGGFPEPTRVQAISMLGRLKDLPGEHRVYEALAKVVQERSFGARNTAINALADYGDKAAIPLIEPLVKADLVFFRKSAEGALARLRG